MGRIPNAIHIDPDEAIKVQTLRERIGGLEFVTVKTGTGEYETTMFFENLDQLRQWAATILTQVAELTESRVA